MINLRLQRGLEILQEVNWFPVTRNGKACFEELKLVQRYGSIGYRKSTPSITKLWNIFLRKVMMKDDSG